MHGTRHTQDIHWMHAMRLDKIARRIGRFVRIEFNNGDRPWLFSLGKGVDENGRLVVALQLIRKIQAANAEINDTHSLRQPAAGKSAHNFHTKTVISQEDVADTRDQNAGLHRKGPLALLFFWEWLYLCRVEKEAVARLAHQPQVTPRIVFENHTDVLPAFVILLEALNGRDLPTQREVQNISAVARFQTYAIACHYLDAADQHMIHLRLILEEVPFPLVHRASSLSGVKPRKTP